MTHSKGRSSTPLLVDMGSEWEGEGGEEGQCMVILSVKPIKQMILNFNSELRLSSNAFNYLNNFMVKLIQCVIKETLKQVDTFLISEIPWPVFMASSENLIPDMVEWFDNHYAKLRKDSTSVAVLFESTIIKTDEFERLVFLQFGPKLRASSTCLNALSAGFIEIVQWIIKVTIRVVEAKGICTIRKGDIKAVIEKAPAFEIIHEKLLLTDDLNFVQSDIVNDELIKSPVESFSKVQAASSSPSLTDPFDLIELDVNEKIMTIGEKKVSLQCSNLTSDKQHLPRKSRIICCTDPDMKWIIEKDCDAYLEGVFVESRGVLTDDLIEEMEMKKEDPIAKMQQEIETLKKLVESMILCK